MTPANQTTRKREFGSGFCRLATRRLKRHNRVEFYKDAMPLDLLISIQDGAGYAFNSIDWKCGPENKRVPHNLGTWNTTCRWAYTCPLK